jgi:hypothetical protein
VRKGRPWRLGRNVFDGAPGKAVAGAKGLREQISLRRVGKTRRNIAFHIHNRLLIVGDYY